MELTCQVWPRSSADRNDALAARSEREFAGYCWGHVSVDDVPALSAVTRGDQSELAVDRVRQRQPVLAIEERHTVVERVRIVVREREIPVLTRVVGDIDA